MRRYQRGLRRLTALAGFLATMSVAPANAFILNPNDPDPWLSTASGSRTGNGTAATITWSIVPDGTATVSDPDTGATGTSNLIAFMNSTFGGSPSQTNLTLQPWFHLFTDSFGRWSQLGGVNFVYEPHDDGVFLPSSNGAIGVRGDIRISGTNVDGSSSVGGGTLAFTYLPPSGSDMVIDTSEGAFFSNNSVGQNYVNLRDTLMHETGHAFGVQHVNSPSELLMETVINSAIDGPQLDEVRAVQYFFGDANEKSNGGLGNGTAARATNLGTISAGSAKSVGSSANVPTQAINATATDFVSISNLDDTDYYAFTVSQPTTLNATLTPRGGVFYQAGYNIFGQPLTPTSFDANARNNLALTIIAANGATVLSTMDANAAGIAESIANLTLPAAGTYYAKITGADDTIQLYELSLSVAAAVLPGDYNRDGTVDAADYVIWRNSVGQSVVAGSGADGDSDGQITSADFSMWRAHFGQSAGAGSGNVLAGAAVPEPTLLLLTISGIAGLGIAELRPRRNESL